MNYENWTSTKLATEADHRGLHRKQTMQDQIDILRASDESARLHRQRKAETRSRYRRDISLCLTFLALRLVLVWFYLHSVVEAAWDWLEEQGIDFGAQAGVLYIKSAQWILRITIVILVVGTAYFFKRSTSIKD